MPKKKKWALFRKNTDVPEKMLTEEEMQEQIYRRNNGELGGWETHVVRETADFDEVGLVVRETVTYDRRVVLTAHQIRYLRGRKERGDLTDKELLEIVQRQPPTDREITFVELSLASDE